MKNDSIDTLLLLTGESLTNFPRSSRAVEVYQQSSMPIVVTGKGSPDVSVPGSVMMGDYLVRQGVYADDVLCETESLDTLANFVLSEPLLQDVNAKHVGVVTEPFHMSRALKTGKRVYGSRYDLEPVVSIGRGYSPFSFVKERLVELALGWDTRHIKYGDLEAFQEYLATIHPLHGSTPSGVYYQFFCLWNLLS